MKENLVNTIKQFSIRKEPIILRSGEKSNIYIDIKKSYGVPGFLSEASHEIHKIIDKKATCVAGMGIGGISLASVYGELYKIPVCIIRDKPKERGTKSQIEAYIPTEKDKIIILDDVYTSGSSIKDTAKILQSINAEIIQACVILTRNMPNLNFPTKSILILEDVL